MTRYTVSGSVQNHNQSKFFVELLDNDQHWFADRTDDLLSSCWTDDEGRFEVTFDDSLYKDNWLEGKPELFLTVRNDTGKIVYKSKTQSPSSPNDAKNLFFDVILSQEACFAESPYDQANTARINAFARIGDSMDLTENISNSSRLLMQTVNAWLLYTNESKWDVIGYDGPQVQRYPWRNPHTHKLAWKDD